MNHNPAAPLVRSELADTDVRTVIDACLARLGLVAPRNRAKAAYYESKQRVRKSPVVPPEWHVFRQAAGWPGTVVDVLEERLDLQGWTDTYGLGGVFTDNNLAVESGLAHLDALIYGTAFVAVDPVSNSGGIRVTVESPNAMTGVWDGAKRRLTHAVLIAETDPATGAPTKLDWFDENEVATMRRVGSVWRWEERARHGLGRCPVVQLVNRPRASRLGGRSEISRAVRALTDSAVRSMFALEINRDFYSFPQRWATGVAEDAFQRNGHDVPAAEVVETAMLVMDPDEYGNKPTVGQFTVNPPTVYLDQIKGLAQLLAAEAAVPAHYLGFVTDNPASADAIRAGEARLVKRAERRQATFGWAWLEVARICAALTNGGTVPDGFGTDVRCRWADPATPTRAATADEAVKLVQAGILPATSQVLYDRLGLSVAEQAHIRGELAAAGPSGVDLLAQTLARQNVPTASTGVGQTTGLG